MTIVSLIKQVALDNYMSRSACKAGLLNIVHVGQAHPCYTSRTAE